MKKFSLYIIFLAFLSCNFGNFEGEKTVSNSYLDSVYQKMRLNYEAKERLFIEYKSTDSSVIEMWKKMGFRNFKVRFHQQHVQDFYEISFHKEIFGYESPLTKAFCFEKDSFSQEWKLYYQAFHEKRPAGDTLLIMTKWDTFKISNIKNRGVYFLPADYTQVPIDEEFVTSFKKSILDSFFMLKQPYYPNQNFIDAQNTSQWRIQAFVNGQYYFYFSNDSTEDKLLFPYLYRACQAAGVKDTTLMRILSQYD